MSCRSALAACAVLVLMVWRADPESGLGGNVEAAGATGSRAHGFGRGGYLGFSNPDERGKGARVMVRNFYGGLKVMDETADEKRRTGPPADARHHQPRRGIPELAKSQGRPPLTTVRNRAWAAPYGRIREGGPVRVGVIGLGTGTLAAYGRRATISGFTKSIRWCRGWPMDSSHF